MRAVHASRIFEFSAKFKMGNLNQLFLSSKLTVSFFFLFWKTFFCRVNHKTEFNTESESSDRIELSDNT